MDSVKGWFYQNEMMYWGPSNSVFQVLTCYCLV